VAIWEDVFICSADIFIFCDVLFLVYVQLVDVHNDVAVIFKCNYLEADARCRPGNSNLFILGRTPSTDVPDDLLAQYSDLATNLCIDDFAAEFIKLVLPGMVITCFYCTVKNDCDFRVLLIVSSCKSL
jgi:hypothetical protein